jgi:putative tryptophan/tyrosine transport system substrate-binding protein
VKRRAFIIGLGAALAAPLAAGAQQAAKMYRLGFLSIGSPYWRDSTLASAFRQTLRDEGWIEGQNLVIEYRWADDDARRLPALARELINLHVDVLFAVGSNIATLAARDATSMIPIVMEGASNPVGAGLISSFAHPGGNVTGLASLNIDLGPKLLELLSQVQPKVSTIAILQHVAHPASDASAKAVARAARAMRLSVRTVAYQFCRHRKRANEHPSDDWHRDSWGTLSADIRTATG